MASQCANKSYQKASVVKGHHVCKVIWTPEVGEELPDNREYGNEHAVAVLKDGEIVGHLPSTISRGSWFFLRRRCSKCDYYHANTVPRPGIYYRPCIYYTVGLHQAFIRDWRLIEQIR